MALGNPILSSALNQINLDDIKKEFGEPPWSRRIVLAEHIAGNVICQPGGFDQNDWHFPRSEGSTIRLGLSLPDTGGPSRTPRAQGEGHRREMSTMAGLRE